MSIGGTPPNSDQLLSQLQGLQRQGLGDRQLTLGPSGRASTKTLFDRFCNFFTSKPSSSKQGNALQKLQAILEQDYGSVGKQVLSSLVGNKKPITVNAAIKQIKLAKGQFQQLIQLFPQEICDTSTVQELARKNPTEAQRLGSAFAKMVERLQPNETQKQVLLELVKYINIKENPKAVLTFAYVATNNPEGAGKFLSSLSGLTKDEQLNAFSSLFEKGQFSFPQCTRYFCQFSCTDSMAHAVNQIRDAMYLNPATDGLTRATQGATEIAKHLITASGQLADESLIAGIKATFAEGIGINNDFLVQQLDRLLHDASLQAQLMNIGKNGISTAAHQAIGETLGLPPGAPITAKEARQAALAAMLSPLRQGAVGSCFATSVAINMHDTRPSEMLRDMASLIEKGFIERRNGNARIQLPFNQSMFKSPVQLKTAFVPYGGQMVQIAKPERAITGNPLLRCWEYTLATSAESQLSSYRNQKLWYLAGQVLDPTSARAFMQQVSFAYDASKVITSSVDGHSSIGAFALTYTSPRSGQKFEIQTAEHLHWALQEFSGRTLMANAQFQSKASKFLGSLSGGWSEDILQAQYGIKDLQITNVQNFQSLPGALLDIAGKVASEARRSGVPMPSHAPMGNQGHMFNVRFNDPILQEGIQTGTLESPEKRQAFLRQRLMEPMLSKELDTNDAGVQSAIKIFGFFKALNNHLASTSGIPTGDIQQVLGRIELQGKYSYADLAKAAYQALKQEFPQMSEAALQGSIMAALAPRCPQMMFADTNWEDDGKPIHWGIQFNPITQQFGLVKGIRNDSGKYDFEPTSTSENKFDKCQIIDDPRVLFRT
jgi:hypothetical protein